jgi:DNA-binding MarR family transcriptional regulator
MTESLPLSALLSQTLVAFTIELDNEFEREMPHRTNNHGATTRERASPWLASYAMWANFLRFVDEDGVTVSDLAARPGVANWAFDGMRRWGYVYFESESGERLAKKPSSRSIVRLRRAGRAAGSLWPKLPVVIEERWRGRLGTEPVDELRGALQELAATLPDGLPHYLPPGDYWLRARCDPDPQQGGVDAPGAERLDLPALMSQVLLVFAVEYERDFAPGLSLSANVIRNLSADPIRMRELPTRAGVAKEITGIMVARLQARGYVTVSPDPSGRGKLVALTKSGLRAQTEYPRRAASVETAWRAERGARQTSRLRAALEAIAAERDGRRAAIWDGLEPGPDNWRAAVPRPAVLPHYPVVTHRGGYPDGS